MLRAVGSEESLSNSRSKALRFEMITGISPRPRVNLVSSAHRAVGGSAFGARRLPATSVGLGLSAGAAPPPDLYHETQSMHNKSGGEGVICARTVRCESASTRKRTVTDSEIGPGAIAGAAHREQRGCACG